MFLLSHLKLFRIVCVCPCSISSAWKSVGTMRPHSQVSQFWYWSVFILALGTRWTWSIRKSCSLVLRTFPELLSLLPSPLLSVLQKSIFSALFPMILSLGSISWVTPSTLFPVFSLSFWFLLSNFYSRVIFFVLMSPY